MGAHWGEYADHKAEIQFAAIDELGEASSARPLSDIVESGDVRGWIRVARVLRIIERTQSGYPREVRNNEKA